MALLYTGLKFTGEDIELLGFAIVRLTYKTDINGSLIGNMNQDFNKIRKWCKSNCSATWGFGEHPKSNFDFATLEHTIRRYFIFTSEADVLALKLAFMGAGTNIALACIWPHNESFTVTVNDV